MAAMKSAPSANYPKRIAVFVPGWIGDAVMATPALRALRAHFESSWIALVGKAGALEILRGADLADGTITDTSAGRPWRPLRLQRTAWRVRAGRFDLALLLPNSFRVALLAMMAGVPWRLGYARDGRTWLLSESLAPPMAGKRPAVYPALQYYIDLVSLLDVAVTDRRMALAVTADGEESAERLLGEAGWDSARPLVMLNPGGAFGPSKRWPAERYAAVADALIARRDAQIIINAAPGEQLVADEVVGLMQNRPLINFAERDNSLALVKSLLQRSQLLVTNDTGARHIAAAMGTAMVTIFGSTDPGWTTIDYDRERMVRTDAPCAPCQKKVCPNPAGPTFHQCMLAIEPAEVTAAAEQLLSARADSGGGP